MEEGVAGKHGDYIGYFSTKSGIDWRCCVNLLFCFCPWRLVSSRKIQQERDKDAEDMGCSGKASIIDVPDICWSQRFWGGSNWKDPGSKLMVFKEQSGDLQGQGAFLRVLAMTLWAVDLCFPVETVVIISQDHTQFFYTPGKLPPHLIAKWHRLDMRLSCFQKQASPLAHDLCGSKQMSLHFLWWITSGNSWWLRASLSHHVTVILFHLYDPHYHQTGLFQPGFQNKDRPGN